MKPALPLQIFESKLRIFESGFQMFEYECQDFESELIVLICRVNAAPMFVSVFCLTYLSDLPVRCFANGKSEL